MKQSSISRTVPWVLLLVRACRAGLQVPLVIINLSTDEATIDMTQAENCIYHVGDFDANYLADYYASWQSADLVADYGDKKVSADQNSYLQQYKTMFAIPNLGAGPLYDMSGVQTLPGMTANGSTPYAVFQAEMDGFGGCASSKSWKDFAITVNGVTTLMEIYDPPTDHWRLIKDVGPNQVSLDIGPGGSANAASIFLDVFVDTVCTALAVVGCAELDVPLQGAMQILRVGSNLALGWGDVLGAATVGGLKLLVGAGGALAFNILDSPTSEVSGAPDSIDPLAAVGFTDIYDSIDNDKLNACIMGHNVLGEFECDAASTTVVIHGDGSILAVPMPQISRAW